MNKRINIMLNEDVYQFVEELANVNSMNVSNTIKMIIAQYRQQAIAIDSIGQFNQTAKNITEIKK